MHAVRFVNKWLERKCSFVHRARARVLARTVGALLQGGKLSLTHLGRWLPGSGYEKHRIKSVDRLLGNGHLHRERVAVYRELAHEVLAGSPRPVLVVGWSDGHPGREWLVLRAAVAVRARDRRIALSSTDADGRFSATFDSDALGEGAVDLEAVHSRQTVIQQDAPGARRLV